MGIFKNVSETAGPVHSCLRAGAPCYHWCRYTAGKTLNGAWLPLSPPPSQITIRTIPLTLESVLWKQHYAIKRIKTVLFGLFHAPNLFSVCNLWWESQPTMMTHQLQLLNREIQVLRHSARDWVCYLFSGNWQWDNLWKDVFFTTPSVCQVWGGKVGYDEVDAELGRL